ncbi:glycosyltransferase family 2 protein [Chondromyces apiculatus]|uniref:Glycosyltransferase n=1 Tax=Chondromyces apiculatus DSM 436 TaxID=1192034 RepID=A0A017SZY1_9BACT|nr:glycosyltransferase [Chondromyces apiculatus]EYF02322.1 Glycosyltransferase [Chondromyces apiculatus DSM 436]
MLSLALGLLYFGVLAGLSAYGLHRLHLVFLCWRHRKHIASAQEVTALTDADLPRVTIQLPLFNESTVAARLLESVSTMDYPADKLEIQVLDDSTDETQALVRAKVAEIRERGVDMVYLHRVDRVGYKAGALDAGLKVAQGDLVAVFDADFIPQPSFLRSIAGHFEDPRVAMVQTRWGHLNRDTSILTKVQAQMLDGHHLVENRARFGAGLLFNFSGTGGIWRAEAIRKAGGWQHDTLTEDLDLSYRAQLEGYRFVYREDVVSPSELPEDISALRAQQYRWAKGTVQTARKLMSTILSADLTLNQRVEAFFHLTPHFAYPLMVLLSVLLMPALVLFPAADAMTMLAIDLPLCVATTGSLAAFYMMAEAAQGRPRWGALLRLPMLIALGTGLAPHLSKAVLEGCRQMAGEFVRTPKHGDNKGRYRVRTELPLVETLLALISFSAVVASIETGHYVAAPFAVLFTLGYGYVALLVAQEQSARRRDVAATSGEVWDGARVSGPTTAAWRGTTEERPYTDAAA